MRFLSLAGDHRAGRRRGGLAPRRHPLHGPTTWPDEFREKLVPVLLVALILGVITSFVKPILTILSIPFIIVTLGLFLLVINAALLRLAGWVADQFDIGFTVTGWWPAIGGAIVITLTTWVVDGILGDEQVTAPASRRPVTRARTPSRWCAWATSAGRRWPTSSCPSASTRPGCPAG